MKKNVLLITSDQQHWNTIGMFNPEISTPNLDRLIERGTYFDRAYTVNPTCTPTRASLITGKYPSQHGAWTLGTKLMETEHTIGEDLIANGYRTELIGKAHFQPLNSTEEYSSLEATDIVGDMDFWKNFNENFYGFENIKLTRNHTTENHVGQHYVLWMESKGYKSWRNHFEAPVGTLDPNKKYVWNIPEEYHYNTWITEETNNSLERYVENNENFFLWTSFFDPHPAYFVPEPWASMYSPDKITIPEGLTDKEKQYLSPFHKISQELEPDTLEFEKSGFALHGVHCHICSEEILRKNLAIYYGMISMLDHYIGKIIEKTEQLGIRDNTLIIFTTDHGHFVGQHGLTAKGPFMYEDLIRVPLITSLPNTIPENKISNSMQSLVDIMPTILDYCNIPIPDGVAGISQKDVWDAKKDKLRTYAICEHNHERNSINLRTYIFERYKITIYMNMEYGEIFDLENDPNELDNLWSNKELKLELMNKALQAEMDREPHFMPRIADA